MMRLIFSIILIFLTVVISYGDNRRVFDEKKVIIRAVVNPSFNLEIIPSIIEVHEVGHKILFSEGYILISVSSNTPFIISFSTIPSTGDISKDERFLETFYIVLPYDSSVPSINDPRWMDGRRFNLYTERPDDYRVCKRKIYIKALKDSPPYGKKEYREFIDIRIKDVDGKIIASGMVEVIYKVGGTD
jgi:hypothetical protein